MNPIASSVVPATWHQKSYSESNKINDFRHYDEKVDIYALGVCLYQLIHGHCPFSGDNKQKYWENTLKYDANFNDRCPIRWVFLLRKMLAKDPQHRPSAAEVICKIFIYQRGVKYAVICVEKGESTKGQKMNDFNDYVYVCYFY